MATEKVEKTEKAEKKKATPKGGRIGGTQFPRIALDEAAKYSDALVRKTWNGPQPAEVLYKGAFNASGGRGQIRAAALRQYGLLQGPINAISATDSAKKLQAAADADKPSLLAKACLRPKVFRVLFDTFHGDNIDRGAIRQQALTQGVHPDVVDDCVDLFVKSLESAGLVSDGRILPAEEAPVADPEAEPAPADGATNAATTPPASEQPAASVVPPAAAPEPPGAESQGRAARSVIQITVSLDSSLDTDKLEKQLQLLRRYGAL